MEHRVTVRELAGYGWVVCVAGVLGRTEGRDGAVCAYESRGEAEADADRVAARVVASRSTLGVVGDGALPTPIGGATTRDSVSPVSPA